MGKPSVPHGAEKAQLLIPLRYQLTVWPPGTPLTCLSLFLLQLNHGGRLDGLGHSLDLWQSLNPKRP